METMVAVIGAILGTGGITAVITALLSARKYKADALLVEQEAEARRKESEQKMNEYIRTQLMEISKTHKEESDNLRAQNKILNDKINELNLKIQKLMEWIVYDNNKYRAWLENELRKVNPNVEFPECRPAPGFVNEPIIGTTTSNPSSADNTSQQDVTT